MRRIVPLVLLTIPVGCDTPTTNKVDDSPPELKIAKAAPKSKGVEWSAVLAAANKHRSAIEVIGEAEQTRIHAMLAQQMARRVGEMTPAERADGLLAVKTVEAAIKDKGPKAVDLILPDIFNRAEQFAPLHIAVLVAGKQDAVNTHEMIEAVCLAFPAWRAVDYGPEAENHKKAGEVETLRKGFALSLFEETKPPAASDFRRLQVAGLKRVVIAQAVIRGKAWAGESAPAWFDSRRRAGLATSVETEADLVIAVWMCGGVLPANRTGPFGKGLVAALAKPGAGARAVISEAATASE